MPLSSLPTRKESLAGWGHNTPAECTTMRPETVQQLASCVEKSEGSLIARGMGRAYGDAALQPSSTVRTERLDRILHFDQHTGLLRAEAGLTLGDLMRVTIPRGWLPPVLPGTQYVTLGGAFACNIHGKNQWRNGDFAAHVRSIILQIASGQRILCSADENAEIFYATAGGMGLTGVIEEMTLHLRSIASPQLRQVRWKTNSVSEMIQCFYDHAEHAEYMVGWLDHGMLAGHFGKGIFAYANHSADASHPAKWPEKPRITVPFTTPGWLLNRVTMAAYSRLRFYGVRTTPQESLTSLQSFFFPLDGMGNWNKLYGKSGLIQLQCVWPLSPNMLADIEAWLTQLHRDRLRSNLIVLKRHDTGVGYIPFSQPGISIALDFASNKKTADGLRAQIPALLAKGCRIYLAKDSLLDASHPPLMWGEKLEEWRRIVRSINPALRFDSLLNHRLALIPRGSI